MTIYYSVRKRLLSYATATIPYKGTSFCFNSLVVLLNLYIDNALPLASTADGEAMAIAHKTLPLIGVQFHPESILTEHGLRLLQNWLDLVTVHLSKK